MSSAELLRVEHDLTIVRTLGLTKDFMPPQEELKIDGRFVKHVSVIALLGSEQIGEASASVKLTYPIGSYKTKVGEVIQRTADHLVGKESKPVVRIGRVGVSSGHRGLGIGSALLSEVIAPFQYNKMIGVEMLREDISEGSQGWFGRRGFYERYDHLVAASPCLYAVEHLIQRRRELSSHGLTYNLDERIEANKN